MVAAAPVQRFDPREQFIKIERLGQIVIGPCAQSGDFFAGRPARSASAQASAALLPPASQKRHAILFGQHPVEQNRIVRNVERSLRGFICRGTDIGLMPFFLQVAAQRRAIFFLHPDDENLNGLLSNPSLGPDQQKVHRSENVRVAAEALSTPI